MDRITKQGAKPRKYVRILDVGFGWLRGNMKGTSDAMTMACLKEMQQ
jgi:hypothetical protein